MNTPISTEAENAVIGSMLVEVQAIRVAMQSLTPVMFHQESARRFYGAAVALMSGGVAVDLITLPNALREAGSYREGDEKLLGGCIATVVTAEHVAHYAKIVASRYYEREIIKEAREMTEDPSQVSLAKIREIVLAKENLSAPQTFNYETDLASFCDAFGQGDTRKASSTGIAAIDAAWMGTHGGEVNTWGAATNVGKSLMLLNLMHLSAKKGRRSLYVGTEMTANETTQRHLAIASGIAAWKIRAGKIDDMLKMAELRGTMEEMGKLPIHILDTAEPNLSQIEAAIVSSKAEVVYLDYLERFNLPHAESMRLRVKEFMRQIKTMARRHDIEIHLAAQLNRTTYGNIEQRPTLADLSESSAVEKESDRVTLMWRPQMKQPPTDSGYAVLEMIQAKNRHGRRGLIFDLRLDEKNLTISEVRL